MKKVIVIAFIGILGLIVPQTQAALIEIAIEAEVTAVSDSGNLLEGNVNVGDTITGSYKYDSEATDTEPSIPYYGSYDFLQFPYGISLEINNVPFKTNPINTDYHIGVTDNHPGAWDVYNMISKNNLPIFSNVAVNSIQWELQDYSEQALTNINLPITAPVLNDWQDYNLLIIAGGIEGEEAFGIGARVTSAVLIPEPATIILFTIGSYYVRKRNHKTKR
jgi:hypothetical protein